MRIFRILTFCSLLILVSCSSVSSGKFNATPSTGLPKIQVPGLEKVGEVPFGKGPQEIQCIDTEHCWLQQGRNLFRSVNGGQSWDLVNVSSESEPPKQSSFYSEEGGWAISLANLYKTEDGGKSWEKQPSPFEGKGEIKALYAVKKSGSVWLAGGLYRPQTKEELKFGVPNNARFGDSVIQEAIFRTDDDGKTWQRQSLSLPLIGRVLDVKFIDENRGIAIGERVVYYTMDGGQNWKLSEFPAACVRGKYRADEYEGQPVSAALLVPEAWWLTYDDGRIVKSENGGRAWCDILEPGKVEFDQTGRQYFRFLHFVDAQRGWALGWDKYLYETKDGGLNWSRATSGARFDSASFPRRNYGLFVSSAGVFRLAPAA